MAGGVPASVNDLFPSGLHVLAVDNDLVALEILEQTLLHCSYQVTTCQRAEDALCLIRGGCPRFDVLITEIRLQEMSGFQLLEEVLKLPVNLPVMLFTEDMDQDMAKEGMCLGACLVLSKPISADILKVMWQLACFHTKRFDSGSTGSAAPPVVPIKVLEKKRDGHLSYQDNSNIYIPGIKKNRLRFSWTEERHNLFVKAIEFLGHEKAVPSKISKYMQGQRKDPNLTRQVIASHLQKYRGTKDVKLGASSDKYCSLETPYLRDTIWSTLFEIPPTRHSKAPSPHSMQMERTSNVSPAVSSSQSTYLDRSNQGLLFQDLSNQDLGNADYEPMMNEESSENNVWMGGDHSFLEELLFD